MNRTKKILLSFIIASFLVMTFTIVITNRTNSEYIEILIYNKDLVIGDKLTSEDVGKIKVKKEDATTKIIQDKINVERITNKTLSCNVYENQIINKRDFIDNQEEMEQISGYKNVSIPITNSSNVICRSLKQGDKISLYFTEKAEKISKVINSKQKIFSNGQETGMVTCIVANDAQFLAAYDASGLKNTENVITDILIRVKESDAILAINLKSMGAFDIVKE